ncbi:Transposase DDE domain-containing protein [Pseudorhodobacter antarcticus]|uniref:Transposase DDE domain-containing protein n=2 Tax=Pseudorhodobacter antarcticus TaxID=1077947 RepID=A0A1H8NRB5_9RHOB|nr:Transposase DDE domain-containing protein [Pseudorhodobacter antarcticus]
MPHKFNAARRHKFEKTRYRITNWSDYNESLRLRGDITVWLSPEVEAAWRAERRRTRGGQPVYSDLAITVCLTLGMVYKQPLRQTEGFVRSLVKLMGLDIRVLNYSTFSRRGTGLTLSMKSRAEQDGPIHLVVDSTGLKIFGEGEWFQNKHKTKAKRKSWRKLHLGLDLVSGDIVCSDLTKDDVGDPTALPDLLHQVDADVTRFIADGAYDGDPTSSLLTARFGVGVEIIIPPPKTAVLSSDADGNPTLRDQRIAAIHLGGRMAWQVSSGYNQRSRGETQMGRWKIVIGPKLKARSFPNQKTETKIGTHILNKMTGLGRAKFEVVA